MPLKLRLKPAEKLVINGAVITAGDTGATLVLHNKASLLRSKDILQPEEANTPAKRIYFQIMLMYLDPQNSKNYMELFINFTHDFMMATGLAEVQKALGHIYSDVSAGEFYRALKTCRAIINLESELLMVPATPLSAEGDTPT